MGIVAVLAVFISLVALFRAIFDQHIYSYRINRLHEEVVRVRQLIRQRADLANELAHEIKNPLTAILCSAEALDLLIGDSLKKDHRETIRYIRDYGDTLLRMVSDFIDISRAEIGKSSCRPESIEILKTVESIVGLLKGHSSSKNLSINIHCTQKDISTMCDPVHLKQILFNLLHNAIKFSPELGKVDIEIRNESPEPFVSVSLRDNGPGIPRDVLPKIFDLYARYETKKSHTPLGTGIGLALCKTLAEFNNGQVTVKSLEGVGSTFEVRLPVGASQPKTGTDLQHSMNAKPLLGQSFLVVDSDIGARNSVSALIEAWGGMVDRVVAASDALNAISSKNYDAVIIDDEEISLDSGKLRELTNRESDQSKTVMIVAARSPEIRLEYKDIGFDLCLEKPFDGTTLLESLSKSGRQIQH